MTDLYKIYKGKVISIKDYGAFISLPTDPPTKGLLHVSQISKYKVHHPSDVLELNEEIFIKIIKNDNGKISLSMKTLNQRDGHDDGKFLVIPVIKDPNNLMIEAENERRKPPPKEDVAIKIEAIVNTTCKRCGGFGHFASNCFNDLANRKYELLDDVEEKPKKKRKHKERKE